MCVACVHVHHVFTCGHVSSGRVVRVSVPLTVRAALTGALVQTTTKTVLTTLGVRTRAPTPLYAHIGRRVRRKATVTDPEICFLFLKLH